MITTARQTVLDTVVADGLCIGCGVCAGVCPRYRLEMGTNALGEYAPEQTGGECLPKCDLCLRACPFWDDNLNEDEIGEQLYADMSGIGHSPETGYHGPCFVGYSQVDGHRANGASGGLATWLLETLLKDGTVEHVACVVPREGPGRLFEFAVLDTVEAIRVASGSAYYPVELSGVVRNILSTPGRYAVIALPCFAKALRLAMLSNPRLRERIVAIIGLMCGQTKGKFFAEYLCAMGGGDPMAMTKARFRVKDPTRPANDFSFRFDCAIGTKRKGLMSWAGKMSQAWAYGYFRPKACSFCDDALAETSDVVLMDAWLDNYIRDSGGTNLVVLRDSRLLKTFDGGRRKGDIHLEEIAIEDVIQSQQEVLALKRGGLSERLAVARFLKISRAPRKRVAPSRLSPLRSSRLVLEHWLCQTSKKAFADCREKQDYLRFEPRLRALHVALRVLRRVEFTLAGLRRRKARLFTALPGTRLGRCGRK